MMKERKLTCIVCPKGCDLTVSFADDGSIQSISGYTCKRGIPYAINECFKPMRTFTSSVKITGSDRRVLPVKTSGPIPKVKLMEAAEALKAIELKVPVAMGDVIVENFLDTGVNLVSAMSL
jgi:CxxC motif-containing protein